MGLTLVNVCVESHSVCFNSNCLYYLFVAFFISLTTGLCVKMPIDVLKNTAAAMVVSTVHRAPC